MDVLYFQQTELAESIRKVLVNFKKDSSDRKSIEYGKTRLDLLNAHWREYELNHEKCIPIENKGHKYFVDSEYERTKESYLEGKSTILRYFEQLGQEGKPASQAEAGPSRGKEQQRPRTPAPPAPASATTLHAHHRPQVEERGIAGNVDAMLRRQRVNFKAFVRTVDGIDLESFREKWEYEDALRVLQSRWAVVDQCHWEIMLELEEDEAYEYNYNKHERTYNGLRKAISSRMWSTSYRDKTTPQMDIPAFSGNFQQWVSFKDLFDETIHNNPSLSSAQKMQFLKSKVKGEAERLIQHLPISTGNYTTCWEILRHRFDNKRSIFNSYANTIYNLANIQQQSFAAIKRLHDVTLESLHAIKNLGIDTTSWDPLLVYILSQKLDNESYSEYIESLKNTRELPVLQEFLDFLENKFTALESSRRRQDVTNKTASSQQQTSTFTSRKFIKPFTERKNNNRYEVTKSLHVSESASKCPHCNSDHRLINCKTFLESTDEQKIFILNKLDFCKNCIYDHVGGKCFSTKRCHKCNDKHHTILHDYFATQSKPTFNSGKGSRQIKEREHHSSNNINVSHQDEPSEILLATALVKVTAADNTQHVMRALIDQGSQVSVISERAAQQLGLKRENCKGVICGVGERESICKGKLKITCQSTYTDFKFTTNALILSNMIKNLPNKTFPKPSWNHLAHIRLADPDFNISHPVDLLLGAEVYSNIIMEGIIRGQAKSEPLAQQTQLGWMLCGGVKTSFQCNVILDNIEDIHQFWKIEDIQEQNEMSVEDQECLDYYKATTKRLDSGRYEVRLPMKPEMKEKLGSSKEIAIAQFKNLERKLIKNESLSKQYKLFISEYEQLKHMKLATSNSIHRAEIECFLPHHAVLKEDSVTTILRVVFNASAKTSSGHSLNDLMYKGPNLQQDLLEIILKWRQYRFAYTADIEKCFRMILVNEQDQYLQQIMWRAHESQPIRAYTLSTITYGTKSAPFLTMMTIRRLAEDEQQNFPNAAKSINEELYMDDWVSGAHSIEEGKKRIEEMNACLKSGGFLLRKWSSNDKQLLEKVEQSKSNQPPLFTFKTENTAKTLGIQWDSTEDKFTFQCDLANTETTKLTKRMLLSEISKIFDPLGWLAPLITKLKLLFQQVWQNSEAQWSHEVSPKIKEEWSQLKKDINIINQVKIPRWLKSKKGDVIELHGFCDASTKAFACVVYARIVTNESASVVLTAAKTRLVPSSKAVTLPRLELCAAELLTNLMTKIVKSITSFTVVTYGWSDSKVTLSWIQGSPERWKPFIANRVKKITSTMPPKSWHYINTKENPADAASRGLTSTQLIEHKLWWQGPTFLSVPNFELKEQNMTFSTNEEVRKLVNAVSNVISDSSSIIEDLLDRYSSFTKVTRIFAWIRRVLTPTVCKQRQPMYLMLPELRSAKLIIIKHVQRIEFNEDIECLLHNKKVCSQSKIASLNPFLDEEGILRAKGRLRNANISTEMKFPIIISYSGRLTELLIEQAHELTFHGGPRLTMSFLRQRYWIVKGNRAIKKQLLKCVTCRKQAPVKLQQIMGDLPDFRTNPAPAFYHTGVDLTGFIPVKANKGRGIKTTKGYVVLFICMVTKAVHIELVSDLTSVSFIAALRRMAARRGAPKHMYSDNGTNFVGANKILQEEYQQQEEIFKESFHREITELNIEWHWNCPSWPSAGGIWERSIRSLKQHLKRVVGEQALTFEEYSTVLARIEASLNSRPLCPISEDIEDIDFLTPAHFLTSNAGLTVIETANDARTRWHLTNKIFQDLWKRWKAEYLSQLSVRGKWLKAKRNIEVGDLVTIHDDNYTSAKFPVGRVIEVHSGNDGFVRVVSLKTKNGIIKRPIIKLSILPIEQNKGTNAEKDSSKLNEPKSAKDSDRIGTKKRSQFINIALSLIFFMSIISSGESANITQFSSNQSLYYDPTGKMHLIRDQWKIVSYYNMQPYWQGDMAVNTFTKYLEQTCDKVKEASHCNMILLQVKHDYSELQYYNQHFGERSRSRRGLINAVGSIANTLFGVLDQSFADKYQKDIELVNSNEKHLMQLWKNQTSVVEAEYNVLKRTEQAIQSQHKLMNKHLNYLDQTTKQLQKEFESMSMIQEFTLAAMATTNMIRNLKQIQDTLIDTLTDIYHGKINLHLLTPKQLNDELQIVSSHISKELTLPVDNIQINLYKVYQLLKVKARMSNDYVIFELSLPLISRDSFHLYHLIPVPLQIGSDMISISLVTDFIATNLMRDSYIPISSIDLQGCEYQDETFFCQLQGPVKHLGPEEKFCQIEQMDTCKIKRESCKNKWVQLHNPSFYLYFACDTYSLTIICDNETRVRRVSKAGLIQLYKQCIAKGRDVTLYSYLQQHTLTLKPDLVLTNIAPIQHHTFNTTLPLVEPFQDKYLNTSLQQLGDKINAMKEAAQQDGTLTTHDVHQYAISYSVLAAGVLVFLWFLWRRYRQAAVSSTPAAPASGVAPQRDYAPPAPPPPPPAPVPPREAPSSSESVSARNESVTEPECSVTGAVRWSSLRKKHNKQSVFTIDRD